ncbi:hypothetical protein R1sor_011695 [Riccia sorocarpa]|uniref:MBD domain-containing protein n=1 Tax=Riccia sorocarpa TaxID=122646 RepID=A0ABD3I523_9MARC
MVKLHPLAGKSGEGPPLAPDQWKWRAGNRLNDMYFTSPTGEKFRSRTELSNFLASVPNPPSAESFQWRVTEEFLASNQVACWDSKTPSKQGGDQGPEKQAASVSKKSEAGSSKKKEAAPKNKTGISSKSKTEVGSKSKTEDDTKNRTEVAAENRTGKRKEIPKPKPDGGRKKVKLEPSSPARQPPVPEKTVLPTPEPIPVPEREGVRITELFPTPQGKARPKLKATKKDKLDKDWEDHEFFTRVLSSKASWKWLYDTEAAAKFLAEAEKLEDKSESEVADLRNLLLSRGSDMNNISRYSNQVLRVFVQILRNVEPPSSMGKVELADLVVNWKCKRKHFWCLLETSRLAPPHQATPPRVKEDASSRSPISPSHDRRNGGSIVGKSAQGASEPGTGAPNEELELEFTLKDIQETVKDIEETQLTPDQVSAPVDLNAEASTVPDDTNRQKLKVKEELDRSGFTATLPAQQASRPSGSMYKVRYKTSESVVVLDRVTGNNLKDQKEGKTVTPPGRSNHNVASTGNPQIQPTSPFPPNYHFPRESSVCWCKICSRDQTFCRGCMCCLCPEPVEPEDDWRAVRCSFCKHLCHVSCALDNKLAGAVQHLNLDGELACPSCSSRVDLWPFFVKSFDSIRKEELNNLQDLEEHTGVVLRLLDGTQNRKYAFFRSLVAELRDITSKLTIQDLARQLLLGISEELDEPLYPESSGVRKAKEAVEDARKKRTEIVPLFDSLKKEYQRITEQAGQIRAAQVSERAKENEDQQPKAVELSADAAALGEKIENQAKKVEQEFQKLMQCKSSRIKPDSSTLAGIDSSMNTYLDSVRAQRKTVEVAETELHILKSSRRRRAAT